MVSSKEALMSTGKTSILFFLVRSRSVLLSPLKSHIPLVPDVTLALVGACLLCLFVAARHLSIGVFFQCRSARLLAYDRIAREHRCRVHPTRELNGPELGNKS